MNDDELIISFPDVENACQGAGEYFFLEQNGEKEKVTFHEYDKIYSIPGLYEELFYDRFECNSPSVVCTLLQNHLKKINLDSSGLNVLDVGAGNGIMGEELKKIGVDSIIGLDILEEARDSALRDRPKIYENYYVADLTDLSETLDHTLNEAGFNCMTIVAALGFGDIPPRAFATGFNYISSPGFFAFNIKEDFLKAKDSTGFCKLINKMINNNILEIKAKRTYCHRLCLDGSSLNYVAVVGEKKCDISKAFLDQL